MVVFPKKLIEHVLETGAFFDALLSFNEQHQWCHCPSEPYPQYIYNNE